MPDDFHATRAALALALLRIEHLESILRRQGFTVLHHEIDPDTGAAAVAYERTAPPPAHLADAPITS